MEVSIPRDETVELIPGHGDEQARREYVMHVREGEISLSHDPKYADQGSRYSAGDEGHLKNLNGQELHAYAHQPAVVEIDTDGFLFDLFGTRSTERPNDRAEYNDDITYLFSSDTIAAGDTVITIDHENTTDETQYLVYGGAVWGNGGYIDSHAVSMRVSDGTGTVSSALGKNGAGELNPDPQLRVEPGQHGQIVVANNDSSSHEVETNLMIRER